MNSNQIRIALYTQQPFVAEGLAAVCHAQEDLLLMAWPNTLAGALDCLPRVCPDVLLIHVTAGISLTELRELRAAAGHSQMILWGQELGGDFSFQAMQVGVRSILPDQTAVGDFLQAIRNVHQGGLHFERELMETMLSQKRVTLTPRQGQIVSMVAQGLRNKEIAFELGITEGTVKVYLYKLFRKLGITDRLDMALYARRHLFSGQAALDRSATTPGSLLLVARKTAGVTVH
ncbi:MAG: response regulator transcription factor [Candidatus Solibacter sp.]